MLLENHLELTQLFGGCGDQQYRKLGSPRIGADAIEQLLTAWIFELMPRTDEEYERAKARGAGTILVEEV